MQGQSDNMRNNQNVGTAASAACPERSRRVRPARSAAAPRHPANPQTTHGHAVRLWVKLKEVQLKRNPLPPPSYTVSKGKTHNVRRPLVAAVLLASALLLSSCQRSKSPAAKRYPFTGRVVSVDHQDRSAIINGNDIPGFMDAMAMPYKVKPDSVLDQLSRGDSISAEVVVVQPAGNSDNSAPDYWLENVKVTAHAPPALPASPAPSGAAQRIPAPGDQVPDFQFTNQNGRRISLQQYRGKTLLVTFIYTRCPFPDYCPRVSGKFAEIYQQLATNPALAGTRLLSVSFDPGHDSPRVLRDYGYSVAHTRQPALFSRWEFATPRAADLPKITNFFGLIYKDDGGTITHSLSTTVIGPDGKIVRWYHGSDWQVSDVIKDAAGARVSEGSPS